MKTIVLVPFEIELEDIQDLFVHQLLSTLKDKGTVTDQDEIIPYVKDAIKNYVLNNIQILQPNDPIIYESEIIELTDQVI